MEPTKCWPDLESQTRQLNCQNRILPRNDLHVKKLSYIGSTKRSPKLGNTGMS